VSPRLLPAAALLAALACNAPHDNPIDPALGGNLDGRVLTRRATGIAGAEVVVPAAGRFCLTDTGGDFSFRGLPADSQWVRVAAEGYVTESTQVGLARGRIDTLARYLNGLPFFTDCRVTSHVWGRGWPPDPLVFFRLGAEAGDPDGATDLDSVWCEIPAIGLSQRLPYDPEADQYQLTLWASGLPDQNPETLVGTDIRFRVADIEGAVTDAAGCRVARLIYDLPVPTFPAGGLDTLTGDTTFCWLSFGAGYPVSYYGEVVRIEGGGPAGTVLTFARPATGDTTWRCPHESLPTGDYYWTIEAFDGFGNSGRSAEQRFHAD